MRLALYVLLIASPSGLLAQPSPFDHSAYDGLLPSIIYDARPQEVRP